MHNLKQGLRNYLSQSLTMNELFLACILLIFNFLIYFFALNTTFDFDKIFSSIVTVLILGIPLYATSKVVFGKNTKIVSHNMLGLLGTMWLMTLVPVNFSILFEKFSNLDFLNSNLITNLSNLSVSDYILLLFTLILLVRLLLLYIFSASLNIERFDIVHIPINIWFLISVILFSIYILFQQPILPGETILDSLLNASKSVSIAYIYGSIILNIYYAIFNRKDSTEYIKN